MSLRSFSRPVTLKLLAGGRVVWVDAGTGWPRGAFAARLAWHLPRVFSFYVDHSYGAGHSGDRSQ